MLLGTADLGAAAAAVAKAERARRAGGGRRAGPARQGGRLRGRAGRGRGLALGLVWPTSAQGARGRGLVSVPAGDLGVLAAALARAEARLRGAVGGTGAAGTATAARWPRKGLRELGTGRDVLDGGRAADEVVGAVDQQVQDRTHLFVDRVQPPQLGSGGIDLGSAVRPKGVTTSSGRSVRSPGWPRASPA